MAFSTNNRFPKGIFWALVGSFPKENEHQGAGKSKYNPQGFYPGNAFHAK